MENKAPKRKKTTTKLKIKTHKHSLNSLPALSAGDPTYNKQAFDILLHAWLSKFTAFLSPASFGMAFYDWLAHFIFSPAKQFSMNKKTWRRALQLALVLPQYIANNTSEKPCKPIRQNDRRFRDTLWDIFPFNFYVQNFLIHEQWWDEATSSIRGVSAHHRDMMNFIMRQLLDIFSPSNFAWSNPVVLYKTAYTGGANFVNGIQNLMEDMCRHINSLPRVGLDKFQVGVNLAVTPGKVIYRNRLIELIQYEATTAKVVAEPILIVPAWIMKYYILDLSPHNSLVKYLVDQGFTVFMISWKNPESDDRDLGLEDYLNLGIMNALDVINAVVPNQKIHAVGYCLGGTLLTIAAAAMAPHNDDRLKTVSLFAAQVDFKDAGELLLFVDESQIAYLEDIMWERGYLDGAQMAGAFNMLHSNDLIWSEMIRDYLLGDRRPLNDLMAWNFDTTRLPFRMHSEYLRSLFLNNDLVQGRFKVARKKIALIDIEVPIFAVGTVSDHVSPWKSVYKLNLFTDTEVTFVLTSGGHNAGIVSEPGHKGRSYQIATRNHDDKHINSETWQEKTPKHAGSWWLAWQQWLLEHSSKKIDPPTVGNPEQGISIICDAPGIYVLRMSNTEQDKE